MKFHITAAFLFLFLAPLKQIVLAQETVKPAAFIIRQIADSILAQASFDFTDQAKLATIKKLDGSTNYNQVFVKNSYNEWRYWNGVLHIAMLDLAKTTGETKYRDFVVKNYDFALDHVKAFKSNHNEKSNWNYPFSNLFNTTELDDCGAEGAGLADLSLTNSDKKYMDYLQVASNHILKKQSRLLDGTFMRTDPETNTVWADDLYMGVIFLAKMGRLTGEQKYFDDAIKQVFNFEKYLYNKATGLYYHAWFNNEKVNGAAHWGRCNGWVMMAQVELLDCLPKNSPHRTRLIQILKNHIIGVSRYQNKNGMWHQLINKNDSYLETSATAMFTYSIAKAVNKGWISKRYATIAADGWNGVKLNIDEQGRVKNICMGTGIQSNIRYYYERATPLNDIHGIGPVLLAGIEMSKLVVEEEED